MQASHDGARPLLDPTFQKKIMANRCCLTSLSASCRLRAAISCCSSSNSFWLHNPVACVNQLPVPHRELPGRLLLLMLKLLLKLVLLLKLLLKLKLLLLPSQL